MKKSVAIIFLTLLFVGCHKQPQGEETNSVAILPPAPSEGCWQATVKAEAKQVIEKEIVYIFEHNMGQHDPFDDIYTAPRTIEVNNFGFKSLDKDTSHLACTAWIVVTLRTKNYGVIVVPKSQITFSVSPAENGPEVSMAGSGILNFFSSLNDAVAKFGLHTDISTGQ